MLCSILYVETLIQSAMLLVLRPLSGTQVMRVEPSQMALMPSWKERPSSQEHTQNNGHRKQEEESCLPHRASSLVLYFHPKLGKMNVYHSSHEFCRILPQPFKPRNIVSRKQYSVFTTKTFYVLFPVPSWPLHSAFWENLRMIFELTSGIIACINFEVS